MIHNHSDVETEFQNQFGDSEYSKEEEMYRKLTIVLLAHFGALHNVAGLRMLFQLTPPQARRIRVR